MTDLQHGTPGTSSTSGTDDAATLAVTCPECGTVTRVRADRRLASDFCPSCDYPLFWARPSAGPAVDEQGDDARWRAPGTSGTFAAAPLACPACAELNVATAAVCVRCGASMTPPPPVVVAPPPPAPVVVVQAPPEQIPCRHWPTGWVIVVTAAVTAAVTLAIVWLA
ncbi:hypothetical protein [Cellulomonas sp. HZM]|uniref:hypothetical protein n=1 Tax=Cellulomonas sp. HZM TaxID=1454010 RepID=UPI000492FD46|nr:hypothetical protein [Cellulomonas sp. HZM]